MRVCFVSASNQNIFFAELLSALGRAVAAAGIHVEMAQDYFPPSADDLAYVFVSHEFLPLVVPEAHPSARQLRRTVAISTDPPGTQWFEASVAAAERAGAVFDINRIGARELRRRGVRTRHLQLGYVPEWDRWGADSTRQRPIDVSFLGSYTRQRGKALARCAPYLARRRADLRIVDSSAPHRVDSPGFIAGDRRWEHMCDAKTLLNIHRDELAYLEWLRLIGAVLNGCVVVSEHSLDYGPLVPGEHLLSADVKRIPLVLDAVLEDDDRRSTIQRAAYELLRDELPLSRTIEPLIESLADLGRQRAPTLEPDHPGPARPMPQRLPPRLTEAERVLGRRTEFDVVRMALKEAVLSQRAIERKLAGLQDELRGMTSSDSVGQHGPGLEASPRVSIVLTVYNYADHVGDAIASVAASDYQDYELIVVDDASEDDSGAQIVAALKRHPWIPAVVITRARNGGLPAARNLAISHARGELIFVLDADNSIYPRALGRLVDALDRDAAAAFAYGIIEQYDANGPQDLTSWGAWDPVRLRYGNFIDAMALIRRSALETVGGFTTDHRLFGWEDFALWCALANRGLRGVHVREIVARYALGLHSMISITNIDTSVAWSVLVSRFPVLTALDVAS